MKVFISQLMNGLTEEEVMNERNKAVQYLQSKYGEIEVLESFYKDNVPEDAGRLWMLGNSIQLLEKADAVYFCDGWEKGKGCIVERCVCELYGLKILV